MTILKFAFAAGTLLASLLPAHADSIVTLCQSDRQTGSGTNLATAVGAGGLVIFNCGGTATIRMSTSITFGRNTVIDGGGTVTLAGGDETMFVASANASIELKNLKFQDNANPIVRGNAKAEVRATTVAGSTFTNCASPFGISSGQLVIRDSVFTNCSGHVVTASERLIVERSRFEGTRNSDGQVAHAIFGGFGEDFRIVDSIFVGNQGGAVMIGTGSASDLSHRVEVVRSTFENNGGEDPNGVLNQVGGISLLCSDKARNCTIRVANSKFVRNRAEDGGAMFISGAAEVSLRGSRFEGNVAGNEGGAIHYSQRSDRAPTNPRLVMQHSVFKENAAQVGGAIRVRDARIVARAVTFSMNRAETIGGGIATQAGAVQIDRGVFLDNSSDGWGAALSLFRVRQSTISNTIIARNRSRTGGAFSGVTTTFINSTIVDNAAIGVQRPWQGVGIRSIIGGPIRFRNTIISNNSAGNCRLFRTLPAGSRRFIDEGTNLQFPDTGCGETIPVANPHLDRLYIPVFGSPPWSRGHTPTCLAEPVSARDVYGKQRPLALACSIGAAEGDLEKEIADRTVGGPAWPEGLGSGGGKGPFPKLPPTPQPSDTPSCCCLFACRR